MKSNFIPFKDYSLIQFTKDNNDIVKRIKEYSLRNCRKEIETSYITKTLNIFDYGIAYFRTELLQINNIKKHRPCAFVCVQKQDTDTLYLLLICSIHNNDKLGPSLMNEIISYAVNNGYKKMVLECEEKRINFYENFNFKKIQKTHDDMFFMKNENLK